jgi:hypothetical protein
VSLLFILQRYKEIKLERPAFRLYERFTYGPEPMKVFLTKEE